MEYTDSYYPKKPISLWKTMLYGITTISLIIILYYGLRNFALLEGKLLKALLVEVLGIGINIGGQLFCILYFVRKYQRQNPERFKARFGFLIGAVSAGMGKFLGLLFIIIIIKNFFPYLGATLNIVSFIALPIHALVSGIVGGIIGLVYGMFIS